MVQGFLVYVGQRDKDTFLYYRLTEINQAELPSSYNVYDKKLFKNDIIGNIMPVEFIEGKVSYKEKALPVGRWHDTNAIIKWQIDNTTNKQYIALQKHTNNNEYKKMLEPIRKAYAQAHPTQRALIIAEVMKAILS